MHFLVVVFHMFMRAADRVGALIVVSNMLRMIIIHARPLPLHSNSIITRQLTFNGEIYNCLRNVSVTLNIKYLFKILNLNVYCLLKRSYSFVIVMVIAKKRLLLLANPVQHFGSSGLETSQAGFLRSALDDQSMMHRSVALWGSNRQVDVIIARTVDCFSGSLSAHLMVQCHLML